jgi:hypothetical protein
VDPMCTRAEMAALFREPAADARNVGVGAWDAEEPVANLRRLQELRPDVSHVETSDAETSAHTVAINERLGFVPVSVVPTFKREL